jgi:uncharacterized protein YqgQ
MAQETHILARKKYGIGHYIFNTLEDVEMMGFKKKEVRAQLDKGITDENDWVFQTIDDETFRNYKELSVRDERFKLITKQ